MDAVSFPVEERLLPRVRIPSNRFEDWKSVAQKEINQVLGDAKSWYYRANELRQSFRTVYEKDAIRGYARKMDDMSAKKDTLCLAHLETTLDDIAFGLHAVTTLDQRSILAQMHDDTFLDGAILRVHEGQTADDPFHFAGLKWIAFTSPAQALVSPRDYVYFEYTGTTQDAANRRVLFQYQRSFAVQPDELLEANYGFMRGVLYNLTLYRMEGGRVLYQSIGCFDPAGEMPSWMVTRALTESFASVKNLVGLADARAIVRAGVIKSKHSSKSSKDSKECLGCQKKFSMLRHRHSCRSCGLGVCKHCAISLKFFNEQSQYSSCLPILTEKFCAKCVQHARERRNVEMLSATLIKTRISGQDQDDTMAAAAAAASVPMLGESPPKPRPQHGGYTSTSLSGASTASSGASSSSFSSPPDFVRSRSGGPRNSGGSSTHGPAFTHSGRQTMSAPQSQASSPADTSFMGVPSYHTSGQTPPTHTRPSVMRASSSLQSHSPGGQGEELFEQMNASIRQQEELLQTIQKERARMQAIQQQKQQYYVTAAAPPPPPPQHYGPQTVPAEFLPPQYPVGPPRPVVGAPIFVNIVSPPSSPPRRTPDEDRFEILS